ALWECARPRTQQAPRGLRRPRSWRLTALEHCCARGRAHSAKKPEARRANFGCGVWRAGLKLQSAEQLVELVMHRLHLGLRRRVGDRQREGGDARRLDGANIGAVEEALQLRAQLAGDDERIIRR